MTCPDCPHDPCAFAAGDEPAECWLASKWRAERDDYHPRRDAVGRLAEGECREVEEGT